MKNGDLYIDDRFEISEDIKNMSKEELRAEIERLEKIAAAEKERIRQSKKEKMLV